jgi:hypothetical protein
MCSACTVLFLQEINYVVSKTIEVACVFAVN